MKQYGINRTARRRVSMGRPCKEELPAIGYLSYTVRETHVTSPKLLEYIIEIKYVRSESIDARTPLSLPFVSRPQIGPRCHRSYTQKRTDVQGANITCYPPHLYLTTSKTSYKRVRPTINPYPTNQPLHPPTCLVLLFLRLLSFLRRC